MDDEISQCEKLLKKGSFAKAQKCYLDALPFQPNNIKVLVRLAEVSYQLNNEEAVRNYVTRAVSADVEKAFDPLMFLAQKMSFRKDNVLAVFILDKLGNNTSNKKQKTKVSSLKSSYLLQKYELKTPRYNVVLDNLGDSINSAESEYLPALSLDGETMVFTRRVGGANEDFFIANKDRMARGVKLRTWVIRPIHLSQMVPLSSVPMVIIYFLPAVICALRMVLKVVAVTWLFAIKNLIMKVILGAHRSTLVLQ